MILNRLHIRSFKNHVNTRIELAPKINCFFGSNAAGKTNILDAIHFLCWTKSYFNSSDLPSLQYHSDFFSLEGEFTLDDGSSELIRINFTQEQGKKILRNNKEYERFSDHIGHFPAIFIAPGDTDLINQAAESRRKFFDAAISQSDRNYLNALIRYNKALLQRNKSLKWMQENRKISKELIEIYDHELTKNAAIISARRKEYTLDILPIFNEMYHLLSGNIEFAGIEYESHLIHSDMAEILEACFTEDLKIGHTSKGIHKDDYQFFINDYPVKKTASQGQQKTYMIALKLAQFALNKNKGNITPLLLFDDIFDKLDPQRVKHLIDQLQKEPFGQIFVTDTHKIRLDEVLQNINPHRIFHVDNGKVNSL